MSTDWNVHCLDCKATLRFDDANHDDKVMAALCKHAGAIAALAPLIGELGPLDVALEVPHRGAIDPGWFAAHLGHRLVPISEYGHILDQCAEYVACVCGGLRRCVLAFGHERPHTCEARMLGSGDRIEAP